MRGQRGRSRREGRLRRVAAHAGAFVLGTILSGIIGTFVLGLSTATWGLVLSAMMLTIILFFELVYQHNVRVGLIQRDRAETLRILMLPIAYLAAVGVAAPLLTTPGGDPTAGIVAVLVFLALVPLTFIWAVVRARAKRRTRRAEVLRGVPRTR